MLFIQFQDVYVVGGRGGGGAYVYACVGVGVCMCVCIIASFLVPIANIVN